MKSGTRFRAPRGPAARLLAILFSLLSASAALAEDSFDDEEPPKPIPSVDGKVLREVRSIPYATGAMHIARGITGAFLGGKYRNLGDDQSLYQWQGELGFFYTDWFSAGLAFKIRAGEPSDTEQEVFNRYYIHLRFHKAWPTVAVYAGPQVGLDNLNVLSGAPEGVDTLVQRPIDNTNAGLGIEMGGGWKAGRWWGLTLGTVTEYSLVGDHSSFFGNDLNIRVIPGASIDVLAFTTTLRELVPALYVQMEFQQGFLLLQRGRRNNDQAFMMGVSLAF